MSPETIIEKYKKQMESLKEGIPEEKGTKSSKSKSPSKKDKSSKKKKGNSKPAKNDSTIEPTETIDEQRLVNLVYQAQRYIEDCSPMCVYIPSNEVLFKMMRACIGCEHVEDLWIYHDKFSFSTRRTSMATEVLAAVSNEGIQGRGF